MSYYRNLTKSDIDTLKKWGVLETDLSQINYAITHTDYYLCNEGGKEVKITHKQARKMLGDELFLSGISRSSFHFTSLRELTPQQSIYFDSSKMFKNIENKMSNQNGNQLQEEQENDEIKEYEQEPEIDM